MGRWASGPGHEKKGRKKSIAMANLIVVRTEGLGQLASDAMDYTCVHVSLPCLKSGPRG